MGDKLIDLPNDDIQNNPFFRLQLVLETIGHSTLWTNQSKFNESPQSCWSNEDENVYLNFGD